VDQSPIEGAVLKAADSLPPGQHVLASSPHKRKGYAKKKKNPNRGSLGFWLRQKIDRQSDWKNCQQDRRSIQDHSEACCHVSLSRVKRRLGTLHSMTVTRIPRAKDLIYNQRSDGTKRLHTTAFSAKSVSVSALCQSNAPYQAQRWTCPGSLVDIS
jgi:hypothetical protein